MIYVQNDYTYILHIHIIIIASSPTFFDIKKHPTPASLLHICNDYSSNRMYTLHGVGELYHIMRAVGDVCYISVNCSSVTAILYLTRI